MTEDDGAEPVAGDGARVEGVEAAEPPPPADPLAAEREGLRQAQDEVAAERAALERERAVLRRAQDELLDQALSAKVQAFEGYDWDKRTEEDPRQAQADWVAYMRARDARDRRLEAARREHGERLEQARAEVLRDIKDWTPETAQKLAEFGRSMGFSDAELGAISDARQIKVLHAAWAGLERERQRAAAEQLAAAQKFAPVPTLTGAAGRIETAADTDDFLAFERLAAQRTR